MANTTSWVDTPYSQRLARQHHEHLRALERQLTDWVAAAAAACDGRWPTGGIFDLKGLRTTGMLLLERPFMFGSGIKKRGTIAYIIAPIAARSRLSIASILYDHRGKLIYPTHSISKSRGFIPDAAIISKHAHERLFERLRTNDWADVINAFKQLATYVHDQPPPIVAGEETAIALDCGEMRATSNVVDGRIMWVMATFVANKR